MGNFCSGGTRSGKDDPLLRSREEAEREEYLLKCKVAREDLQARIAQIERELGELQPRIEKFHADGNTKMALALLTQKKHLEQQRDASYTQISAIQRILSSAEQFGTAESITALLEQGNKLLSPQRAEGVQERMMDAVDGQGTVALSVQEMNDALRVFSDVGDVADAAQEELARMDASKRAREAREADEAATKAVLEAEGLHVPSAGPAGSAPAVAVLAQ